MPQRVLRLARLPDAALLLGGLGRTVRSDRFQLGLVGYPLLEPFNETQGLARFDRRRSSGFFVSTASTSTRTRPKSGAFFARSFSSSACASSSSTATASSTVDAPASVVFASAGVCWFDDPITGLGELDVPERYSIVALRERACFGGAQPGADTRGRPDARPGLGQGRRLVEHLDHVDPVAGVESLGQREVGDVARRPGRILTALRVISNTPSSVVAVRNFPNTHTG